MKSFDSRDAIPTLIFFKEGQVVEQIMVLTDRAKLEAAIENII